MLFKLEAEHDTVYIRAESLEEAQDHITDLFGSIPEELLKWTEIDDDDLPDGEPVIEFEAYGPGELFFGDGADADVVELDFDNDE